ncbi:MAG: ubiG 2, partial [Thermomicrobiales bacterium]|nr:ubiG 2 [Thermomicrobiales bacterium]
MDQELPEHAQKNRIVWDTWATEYAAWAPRAWAQDAPTWGIFRAPEAELGVFPESVAGLDIIELGCGTAYISAWLARRGARPVGIDNSPAQLATARRMQEQFRL